MQFDDFLSVLDLLQNPDKYAAKIAELTKREGELADALDLINKRVNVAITQEQADSYLVESSKTLAETKVKAQKIVDNAQVSFDKRLAELAVKEVAAEQAMTTYRNSKLQWSQRVEEHRAKEEQILKAQKQLDADRADLASKQVEVDARLDKLRQAMG